MRLGEDFAEAVILEKLEECLPHNVGVLRGQAVGHSR